MLWHTCESMSHVTSVPSHSSMSSHSPVFSFLLYPLRQSLQNRRIPSVSPTSKSTPNLEYTYSVPLTIASVLLSSLSLDIFSHDLLSSFRRKPGSHLHCTCESPVSSQICSHNPTDLLQRSTKVENWISGRTWRITRTHCLPRERMHRRWFSFRCSNNWMNRQTVIHTAIPWCTIPALRQVSDQLCMLRSNFCRIRCPFRCSDCGSRGHPLPIALQLCIGWCAIVSRNKFPTNTDRR